MDTKMWAVFFIALVSFEGATAFFFGGYKGVDKRYDSDGSGYYGWNSGCQCNDDLTSSLDDALGNVRAHLGRYNRGLSVRGHNLEEYELTDGRIQGFHKMQRKGPYRCSMSRQHARIYFRIGFFQLLVRYSVSVVEDFLNDILGGVGSFFASIFGRASNLLFRIILSDVYATCVLVQRFDVKEGMELEGLYFNEIRDMKFQGRQFSRHRNSLISYLRPVCDHAVRFVFKDSLEVVFRKCFSEVIGEKNMFSYESNEENEEYEEEDDD